MASPIVRIDGVDIESAAADRGDFGLQCRAYLVGGKFYLRRLAKMIEEAIAALSQPSEDLANN